jgi:peptide/nickel transport system permease protein
MSTITEKESQGTVKVKKPRPLLVDVVVRMVKQKPLGVFGGIIVLAVLFVGLFPDFVAPHGISEINADHVLEEPSTKFLMGTDNLGRDVFSRVIYGARISMIVGLAAPAINLLVSLLLGVTSGFIGGKFDIVLQRLVDAWMCFPALIMTITVMSLLGPGLTQVVLVLGISGGITGSRTIRSAVIGIKENIYVEAARAVGSQTWRTLMKHILPNIMPIIIIVFTLHMSSAILAEASLSFLGYGIPPPAPSWGGMLSGSGRKYMEFAPWMALWPGLALSFVVYGISMFGDAIRDLLDPRLRGGIGRYGRAVKLKKTQGRK